MSKTIMFMTDHVHTLIPCLFRMQFNIILSRTLFRPSTPQGQTDLEGSDAAQAVLSSCYFSDRSKSQADNCRLNGGF
jgi:hypothetical protein